MYYYVINPAAGKGAINRLQEKLRERLRELGIDGEFAKTTGLGDATKMTKAAIEKGYNTIVVVGGDGTVNEAINGITKENVAVGIIPIGTSNLLAHHMGINSWQQACEVLAARRLASYGLIAAGQKVFLSTLTLGFETDIDKQMETAPDSTVKARVGQFVSAFGQAREYAPLKCHIKVDGRYELESPLFSLTVSNQKFDNPLAENKLVVTIFEKPGRKQLTTYLWGMLKKNQLEEGTTRFKADRVVIETDPQTGMMIDGKVSGRTPIAIRLTDRRVRFITEKQSNF
ncbi:MAG TPA: diacylglycerol kinase family protein [Candidatus Saccharimonadales bacterium]|nr:diacylglycerol kinase family protein [Candidatus Saccharimonadales bacterium]